MGYLKKLVNLYNRIEEIFLVMLLSSSVIIIFYQVVMRYAFNNSPPWTEELAKIMFVWMSWLGISLTQKRGEHICIELMTSKLKGKKQVFALILGNIITIVICAVMIKYGYIVMDTIMKTRQTSSVLKFPTWIVYLSCPFSCVLMILRLLGDTKRRVGELMGYGGMEAAG